MEEYLTPFAGMCRMSLEYQGHGFGLAFRREGQWHLYKRIHPVWEEEFSSLGACDFLIAHARSAFRNEGIQVENNMPFTDRGLTFIFNGELHGVKVKSPGRIGAEKLFHYILRFHRGDPGQALEHATRIIRARTRYVKAMNILMTDGERIYVSSHFEEDPDYFTLHHLPGKTEAFCSQPLGKGWKPVPNRTCMAV